KGRGNAYFESPQAGCASSRAVRARSAASRLRLRVTQSLVEKQETDHDARQEAAAAQAVARSADGGEGGAGEGAGGRVAGAVRIPGAAGAGGAAWRRRALQGGGGAPALRQDGVRGDPAAARRDLGEPAGAALRLRGAVLPPGQGDRVGLSQALRPAHRRRALPRDR